MQNDTVFATTETILETDICGENATYDVLYTTDASELTLRISGTGAMYDYDDSEGPFAPWWSKGYSAQITQLVVCEGITHVGSMCCSGYYTANIASVTLPDGLISIGSKAFGNGLSSLTSITIPETVEEIGYMAFLGSGLQSIVIPNSVSAIEESTFSNCSSLVNVTLGEGVESIDILVFDNCSSLNTLTCLAGTPPEIVVFGPTGSSSGIGNFQTIAVYEDCLQAYLNDQYWAWFGPVNPFTQESQTSIFVTIQRPVSTGVAVEILLPSLTIVFVAVLIALVAKSNKSRRALIK